MKKLTVYLFILLAIAVTSNGQDHFVLEGTIGKYPVVMKIEKQSATYFYKNSKHDIELEGTNVNPRKLFFKKDRYDPQSEKEITAESLTIEMTGNGSLAIWTGSWNNAKGTSLPVSLKLIDTAKYNFSQLPEMDFYTAEDRIYHKAKLSGLSFIKDSVTTSGQYQLQWLHESFSKTQLLEIRNGFPAGILKKINEVFRKKSFAQIKNYFSCSTGSEQEGEYTSFIHGYFISPKYISIRSGVSYECGGAHPDAGDISFTVDAVTGKEITRLDEVYWFTGKKPLSEKDAGYDTYIQERTKVIIKILTGLYPAQMKKPVEDGCDYTNITYWYFPDWVFTEKGLYVAATFPHAMMPCNGADFGIIPYTVLKQYERK